MDYSNLTDDELRDKANQLEDDGCYREAITCWRLLFTRTSDAFFLVRLGNAAEEINDFKEAEQSFLSAIDLAPRLSLAYECLGSLYLEKWHLEKACEYLNKCLAIKKLARTYSLLGVAQNRLGKTMDARESYRQALQKDPNYEEAAYNLAVTLKDEQPNEALILLKKAIELDPEYVIANRELGWLLFKKHEYSEAEYYINKAIELDPSDRWAYAYLGYLAQAINEFDAVEEAFIKAIEVWSDESLPYWCLANFYQHQGRADEAQELYRKITIEIAPIDIKSTDLESNLRYGIFFLDIGEIEKAKVYLDCAFQIRANDERVKSALFRLNRDQQQDSD